MADSREPPPLFNDDREDDNDDLFSSAVQVSYARCNKVLDLYVLISVLSF